MLLFSSSLRRRLPKPVDRLPATHHGLAACRSCRPYLSALSPTWPPSSSCHGHPPSLLARMNVIPLTWPLASTITPYNQSTLQPKDLLEAGSHYRKLWSFNGSPAVDDVQTPHTSCWPPTRPPHISISYPVGSSHPGLPSVSPGHDTGSHLRASAYPAPSTCTPHALLYSQQILLII